MHFRRVHVVDKKIKCDFCPRTFFQISNLEIHLLQCQMDYQQEKCEFCDSILKSKKQLAQHINNIHKGETFDEKCEICEKSFKDKGKLKLHYKVHQKEKPFQCNSCVHSFSSMQHLQMHIKSIHSKIKDQQCHLCGKSFSLANSLKTHIRLVHDKLKSFKCEFCDESFVLSQDFKKHLRMVHSS